MCFCEPGRLIFSVIRKFGVFGKILATITDPNYLVLSAIKWCSSGPIAALFWSLLEGDKALSSDRAGLAKANPLDLMEVFE